MLKKILAVVAMLYAVAAFAAVDVNKATAAELDSIKGIGPSTSSKILDERNALLRALLLTGLTANLALVLGLVAGADNMMVGRRGHGTLGRILGKKRGSTRSQRKKKREQQGQIAKAAVVRSGLDHKRLDARDPSSGGL